MEEGTSRDLPDICLGLQKDRKIEIQAEFDQLIGDNVSKLTHFVGTIARNGMHAPMTSYLGLRWEN